MNKIDCVSEAIEEGEKRGKIEVIVELLSVECAVVKLFDVGCNVDLICEIIRIKP